MAHPVQSRRSPFFAGSLLVLLMLNGPMLAQIGGETPPSWRQWRAEQQQNVVAPLSSALPPPVDPNSRERDAIASVCQDCQPKKSARTLFNWAVGKEQNDDDVDTAPEEDRIVTDRPDFTEASSTVGQGRIQFEVGYTYFYDDENGVRTRAHSYPEVLARIGMFADWFELRIFQNFGNEHALMGLMSGSLDGANDLGIGTKIGLTEQKGCLPEMAIIFQATLPTGADDFSADTILPGVNWLYSWEIIEDFLSIGGSTQANRVQDDLGGNYVELAQSLTTGVSITDRLGGYLEYFGFYPTGSTDPSVGPQHFIDGGFTFLVTNNFQLDVRVGVGLNETADDFFTGAGFSYRY